jgi:hypothetical protein
LFVKMCMRLEVCVPAQRVVLCGLCQPPRIANSKYIHGLRSRDRCAPACAVFPSSHLLPTNPPPHHVSTNSREGRGQNEPFDKDETVGQLAACRRGCLQEPPQTERAHPARCRRGERALGRGRPGPLHAAADAARQLFRPQAPRSARPSTVALRTCPSA